MRATRLLIRGIVQGVGYRFFARRTARAMGVRGTVRNLPDGRVEAVAAGSPDSLAVFIGELRRGPSGSRVDGIEATDAEMDDQVSGYSILA
jgi:acylphosphatase